MKGNIERCKILLHLIDITNKNLIESYKQVRYELGKYSKDLLKKEEIVVFNKIDLIDNSELLKKKKKFYDNFKIKVLAISTLDKKLISIIKSKLIKYVS